MKMKHYHCMLAAVICCSISMMFSAYRVNKLTDIDDKTMEEIAFYDETILVLQPVESEIKAYLETHDYLNLDPEINDSTWMMAFNSDTKVLIDKLKTTGNPVIDNADLDKKTYITLSGFFSSLVDRYIGYTGAFGGGDKDEHKMEDVFSAYHFIHIHQYQLLRRLERFVQIISIPP